MGYDFSNINWQNQPIFNFNNNWNGNWNNFSAMNYASQPMFNFNSNNWNNFSYPSYSLSNTFDTSASETVEEYRARIKRESEAARNKANVQRAAMQEQDNEEKNWKLLSEDYRKSMTPSESLLGAAAGGAAFGVVQNPRTIAHPINTVKGFKDTKTLFKGVKESGTVLNTAWKANSPVMEEAYAAMQKLSSRHNSKLGLFRKSITDTEYNQLKNIMEEALRPGSNGKINIDKVAEATAKLKHSYVNDGYIPRAWNKIKGWFGGTSKVATVSERLGETEKIAAEATKILEHGKDMSFKTAFKSSGGFGGAALMAGIEVFMAKDKIAAAFAKDKETGWTQVRQTAVKAGGSAAGWAIGQSLGALAWAKLGASVGTCFGPGIGTAIGAVVGLAAGSIGCWAAGKLTHWLMGDDVGDAVLAENKQNTDEGKLELLQNAIVRAQSGEIKDEKVLLAVNELASKYAAIA